VIRHEPGCCAAGLSGAEEAGIERRQVIDVPPVRPEITEHQVIARRHGCGTVTRGQAPDGVTAPVQYGPRISGIGGYLWHGQFLQELGTQRRFRARHRRQNPGTGHRGIPPGTSQPPVLKPRPRPSAPIRRRGCQLSRL
jgi:transposase